MGINLYSFYLTLPTPPPQLAMPASYATDVAQASLSLLNPVQVKPQQDVLRHTKGWTKDCTPTADGELSLTIVQAIGSPPNLLFQDHVFRPTSPLRALLPLIGGEQGQRGAPHERAVRV